MKSRGVFNPRDTILASGLYLAAKGFGLNRLTEWYPDGIKPEEFMGSHGLPGHDLTLFMPLRPEGPG
jgi:hypothetical protein